MSENEIATIVVQTSYEIHLKTGPGMLERVYQDCLVHSLRKKGLKVEQEKSIPFTYEDLLCENAFRLDLLVEGKVIVEVKSCSGITDIHLAQVITYLKLTKLKLGLIINFNSLLLKNGIRRVANGL